MKTAIKTSMVSSQRCHAALPLQHSQHFCTQKPPVPVLLGACYHCCVLAHVVSHTDSFMQVCVRPARACCARFLLILCLSCTAQLYADVRERQAAMEAAVEAEDYGAAAAQRDAVDALMLRRRQLEILASVEARKVRFRPGAWR